MGTCKNCDHGCHCSNGSSCTSCECKDCDCENDSLKKGIKILSDLNEKNDVIFTPDFSLTSH